MQKVEQQQQQMEPTASSQVSEEAANLISAVRLMDESVENYDVVLKDFEVDDDPDQFWDENISVIIDEITKNGTDHHTGNL